MMALVAVSFAYASGFVAYEIGQISAHIRIRMQQYYILYEQNQQWRIELLHLLHFESLCGG